MATKQRKVGGAKSAVEQKLPLACASEPHAFALMEEQRGWTTEADAVCQKCGVVGESYQMKDARTGERNTRYLWRCRACKGQYTVKVGTIMEDSPIPMTAWCYAFWKMSESKKGVSAMQIHRATGLSYKSALFLSHRIRWAMAPANAHDSKLGANGEIVEFDETYVGGKPRYQAKWVKADGRRKSGPAEDFSDRKTPVVGGVERDGRVRARVVMNVTAPELAKHVFSMVDPSAHLMTDHAIPYKAIGEHYAGHDRVKHNQGVYVRYGENGLQITTNRIEGFWAGLKRQIGGTHHAVSRKHLHRYVAESEFKYNSRHMNDGERTVELIRSSVGRRLTYREQVARPRDEKGRYKWR